MFCHWRYVIDNLIGPIKALSCMGATHIGKRLDENGEDIWLTELDGDRLVEFVDRNRKRGRPQTRL